VSRFRPGGGGGDDVGEQEFNEYWTYVMIYEGTSWSISDSNSKWEAG
jgi:hypothetical protein